MSACQLRRNLVVSGLNMATLHSAVLAIDAVQQRVVGGCPPGGYLSRLLGIDARHGLRHIGGARAAIIQGGLLRVGAAVDVIEVPA